MNREDVYELLRLYEVNPRAAFKPHLQPDDWRERERTKLHFRIQVPDNLEDAFDIAIGEGLLKQHLIKPEDQFSVYKSFGIPVPVLDGSGVPANADALIQVTEKGRAVLAAYKPTWRTQADVARRLEKKAMEISRLCDSGDLVTNGKTGPKKRIDEASAIRYAKKKELAYNIGAT